MVTDTEMMIIYSHFSWLTISKARSTFWTGIWEVIFLCILHYITACVQYTRLWVVFYRTLKSLIITVEINACTNTQYQLAINIRLSPPVALRFVSFHGGALTGYSLIYTKFWALWQKLVNHFWLSVDSISDEVSVTDTSVWCLTINLKTITFLIIFSVPKITLIRHGRPNHS